MSENSVNSLNWSKRLDWTDYSNGPLARAKKAQSMNHPLV